MYPSILNFRKVFHIEFSQYKIIFTVFRNFLRRLFSDEFILFQLKYPSNRFCSCRCVTQNVLLWDDINTWTTMISSLARWAFWCWSRYQNSSVIDSRTIRFIHTGFHNISCHFICCIGSHWVFLNIWSRKYKLYDFSDDERWTRRWNNQSGD